MGKTMEPKNEIVVYQPNETVRLDVRLENDTVWLTQLKIAELFGVQKAAISKHVKNIFASNELVRDATVSKMETVQIEGGRTIVRIRDFIMELGGDFTFVGKEYPVKVGKSDFNIDLLFFNRALRCFFAVEVKTDEFEPSYLGQLQGYVAACDMVLNTPQENPAIGLLVCRGKNAPLAKCLLGKIDMPIGVSGYELLRKVPEDFKSQLPTIEEIEAELANMKNGNGV